MRSVIYSKYSDCKAFNNIKTYLNSVEKKARRCRSDGKIMARLKQCENAQNQLDVIRFRLMLADQNAQVFNDYVQSSEIDNSEHFVLCEHKVKVTLHLSPQILADFGMDGMSSLIRNRCNKSFAISSNLRLPYTSLKHVDLIMYENVSKHDHDVRKQIYDSSVFRASPDNLPF